MYRSWSQSKQQLLLIFGTFLKARYSCHWIKGWLRLKKISNRNAFFVSGCRLTKSQISLCDIFCLVYHSILYSHTQLGTPSPILSLSLSLSLTYLHQPNLSLSFSLISSPNASQRKTTTAEKCLRSPESFVVTF